MKLKRDLGLLAVFCIASGAMISSGLFILPGMAFANVGPALPLSYLLAGVLAAFGMLCEIFSCLVHANSFKFSIILIMRFLLVHN